MPKVSARFLERRARAVRSICLRNSHSPRRTVAKRGYYSWRQSGAANGYSSNRCFELLALFFPKIWLTLWACTEPIIVMLPFSVFFRSPFRHGLAHANYTVRVLHPCDTFVALHQHGRRGVFLNPRINLAGLGLLCERFKTFPPVGARRR